MSRINLKLLCLILFALLNENLFSQDTLSKTNNHNHWLYLGGGGGSAGLAGGLGISYQTGSRLISLRFISNQKYSETWLGGYTTPESIWDVGALYGLITKKRYGYASISGGISLAGGKIHGKYLGNIWWIDTYEKVPVITAGIPLEGRLFFTPFRGFGIGVNAFADLNIKKTFGGVLLCIEIGKLR